jgi:hypothetical protein
MTTRDTLSIVVVAGSDREPFLTTPGREETVRDLLADDASRRRSAYERARRHRWFRLDAGTAVRAILIDAAVADAESTVFARRLSRLRPVPAYFAGRRSNLVFVVGPPSDGDLDGLILREAESSGIRVLGIGSASPDRDATDLVDAADEAALAATLAAALPQFHPAVDARDLGGWLLLASTAAAPNGLATLSPAADALCRHADQSQRVTIETYLDVGANVVAACDLLFLHRTTLYYRLDRMPPVVKEALADGFARSTLHLALKLVRLWEATGRM